MTRDGDTVKKLFVRQYTMNTEKTLRLLRTSRVDAIPYSSWIINSVFALSYLLPDIEGIVQSHRVEYSRNQFVTAKIDRKMEIVLFATLGRKFNLQAEPSYKRLPRGCLTLMPTIRVVIDT